MVFSFKKNVANLCNKFSIFILYPIRLKQIKIQKYITGEFI